MFPWFSVYNGNGFDSKAIPYRRRMYNDAVLLDMIYSVFFRVGEKKHMKIA